MIKRELAPDALIGEKELELGLRPKSLKEYIGHEELKKETKH